MKILHTADLHLGQILYQNYDRVDEHEHFFNQLGQWCSEYEPDALIVSGDVFDTQQPSAAVRTAFTGYFVRLHDICPRMSIVITAGNHDSASRLQADKLVWERIGVSIIGLSPSVDLDGDEWKEDYIIRLDSGFIVALPYMIGNRREQIQGILDSVEKMNTENKPVVLMAHTAVTGCDVSGHGFEIGTLKTQDVSEMGRGWDYLALGHIHKSQTLGHEEDRFDSESVTYAAPIARYSGSALHVSCDETFPHSVSLVEIDKHNGSVRIQALHIRELRHFHILPEDGSSFKSSEEALESVRRYAEGEGGYFRLRVDHNTTLPSNFSQAVYDVIGSREHKIRFNPKIIWTGMPEQKDELEKAKFEIADLQQMTDPVHFVEKTIEQYQGLDLDTVRNAFAEVLNRMESNQE